MATLMHAKYFHGAIKHWRSCAMALCLALAPLLASAQPPNLMHYQGRLTNTSGAPIVSATVVYFSLWQGGTAGAANSGTEKFREHATITPNTNGYFDHEIGSGTLDTGALNSSVFATTSPVYIQVAVGAVGTVLLPRARVDSVGFAFSADRVTNKDGVVGPPGNPQVAAVADVTGGVVVGGDLLRLTGSAMSTAIVLVGGKVAPIKFRTATQIDCLVPQGLKQGLQEVAVTSAAGVGSSVVVAHVDIHRLAIGVSTAGTSADNIFVIDTSTRTLLAEIPNSTYAIGATSQPIQIGFAHQGSLAFVPDNNAGLVYAIDLTANPPVVVDSVSLGSTRAVAAAGSPDSAVMIGCGIVTSALRACAIGQGAPPYGSTALSSTTTGLNMPSGFSLPRACAFFGDGLLVAVGTNSGVGWGRFSSTAFIGPIGQTGAVYQVTAVNAPISAIPSRDYSRLLMVTADATNFRAHHVEPAGLSQDVTPASVAAGTTALQVAVNAADDVAIIADRSTDRIYIFQATPTSLLRPGWLDGPTSSLRNSELAAMDPVDGGVVAVGTDDASVTLYTRTGPNLRFSAELDLAGSARHTYALAFQP